MQKGNRLITLSFYDVLLSFIFIIMITYFYCNENDCSIHATPQHTTASPIDGGTNTTELVDIESNNNEVLRMSEY